MSKFLARKPKMYDDSLRILRKLDTASILDWADQAGSFSARHLMEYRRNRTPDSLVEARDGMAVLSAAVDALLAREQDH